MGKRTAPRIIAGKLRGRRLKSVAGTMTRPITDRVKENLFNILGTELNECRFLDLFAGTGSVGIEAFSRGAHFVQLIEKNQQPYLVLKQNLNLITDIAAFSQKKMDAFKFIPSYSGAPFDFIFIAPPQYKDMWERSLKIIDTCPKILRDSGKIIVQIDPLEIKDIHLDNFLESDRRQYGSTLLIFYQKVAD